MSSATSKTIVLTNSMFCALNEFVLALRGTGSQDGIIVSAALMLFFEQDGEMQTTLLGQAHADRVRPLLSDQMLQRLRAFKDAPVGLCSFDTELRYTEINDFLAAINGIPAEEHIGKTVREVLPEIAAAGVEQSLREVLETGTDLIQDKVTAETPAHPEEKRTYMHNYYAIRSADNELVGVRCCVVDSTDHELLPKM